MNLKLIFDVLDLVDHLQQVRIICEIGEYLRFISRFDSGFVDLLQVGGYTGQ